jgi:hypothetical protein
LVPQGPLPLSPGFPWLPGGKFARYHGGQACSFATFAPVGVAAIGTLPLPIMRSSIVIRIARRDGWRQLTRLDVFDHQF